MADLALGVLIAACLQVLTFALPVPDSTVGQIFLLLLRTVAVSLSAWAASRFRPIHVLPAAVGALIGTVLIWVVVVIRRDAQEVGAVGAVMEGVLIGGVIAVPGVALFLLVRRRLATPRKT